MQIEYRFKYETICLLIWGDRIYQKNIEIDSIRRYSNDTYEKIY